MNTYNELINEGFDRMESVEILQEMKSNNDFELYNHRFILTSDIDSIQEEELEGDLYLLGCFNSDFISGILNISESVIKSMQDAGAYEAVGKLIIDLSQVGNLQEQYSSLDGYGHHFAHYDGNEHDAGLFSFFKIN